MKHCLTSVTLFLILITKSAASLVLSDDFAYPDGNLISAGRPWVAHSGAGSNSVQIASGRAIIVGGNQNNEDVSALLAGQPYATNGAFAHLYAGFTISATTLPNAVGTYFAHFQAGTNVFRARVWASTTNAAGGKYRVGVGNSSAATATSGQIEQDLLINTNYRVVVRYTVTNGLSTIWVNPTVETAGGVTATDSPSAVAIERFGFRQGISSTAGSSGTLAMENLFAGTAFTDVIVIDQPPTISAIADQGMFVNGTTGPLAFTVGDDLTPPANLILSRNSDNLALVPLANIVLGGSGANRTVTVTPMAGQAGFANITVIVGDGTNFTPATFRLTVVENLPPTITAIPDQGMFINGNTGPLNFTIGDDLTSPGNLALSRNSDNIALVPLNNVVLGGSGANRTVTVTPVLNQSGLANITVSVNDGTNNASAAFRLTVVVNNPPTISVIPNKSIFVNSNTGPLSFTIGDALTSPANLTLSRNSDNLALVPLNNIVFGGAGASRTVTVTPLPDQLGNANITVTVNDGTNNASSAFLLSVVVNLPPTISAIGDREVAINGNTGPLNFVVGDDTLAPDSLTLSRNSDNLSLVPLNNIVLGGSGASRTVTVTTALGQVGSANITVTVGDVISTASSVFRVSVATPGLAALPDQITPVNVAAGPVAVTLTYGSLNPAALTLSAQSSNTGLLPAANVTFSGSGGSRTVTATPLSGQTGLTTISVTASDGVQSAQQSFRLTVKPNLGLLVSDNFSRAEEGSAADDINWWTFRGTAGETQILLDRLELSQTQSEGIHRRLHPTTNFDPGPGYVLYAGFKVKFTGLPTGPGNFFAHFNTNSARARIFARTNFATPGKFQLGIANAVNVLPNDAALNQDLSLNQEYLVAVRYNVATGESRLWVNPAAETDVGVAATDTPQLLTLDTFAFRQSGSGNPLGMGTLTVDDFKLGTALAEVVELAPRLSFTRTGTNLRLSWPTGRGFLLRSTPALPTTIWNNVSFTTEGANDVADLGIQAGNGILRLEKSN